MVRRHDVVLSISQVGAITITGSETFLPRSLTEATEIIVMDLPNFDKPTIRVDNLYASLNGQVVLKGVDLHVESGDIYGQLGPNTTETDHSKNLSRSLFHH